MVIKIDGEVLTLMIKEKREQAKLSQVELSRLAGVSRAYISELEAGKYMPTVVILIKLARALNCTINDLIKI